MKKLWFVPIKKDFTIKSLFQIEKDTFNIVMTILTIGLLGLFAVGVTNYLIHGHHAYNVTREHPWGLLIATYIFFVVSSTGLCIISSLGHVFGIKEFEIIGKRAILGAILTLLTGFIVIFFEIGHPFRMLIYNITSPGFTSAIWGMGTLYSIYLVFIMLEFLFLIRHEHKRAFFFGVGGLIVGIAAHSNLGAVFGFLIARPMANGIFYPIYFILSAMITGAYLVFLIYSYKFRKHLSEGKFPLKVTIMFEKLEKILALLLVILLFMEIWRMFTAIYGGVPERADTAWHILHSKTFLIGEIFLGILVPLIVIAVKKGRAIKSMIAASISGMIGIFFMRYDLVHDVQVYPMQTLKIREYQLPPSFIEYTPSFTEIAIAVGAIGVCFAMYYVAEKLFDINYYKTEDDLVLEDVK